MYEFFPDDRPKKDSCNYNRTDPWCEKASEEQVIHAIQSAQDHPGCIVGIVVGNEDLYKNERNKTINEDNIKRIVRHINQIKSQLQGIPVGTAQQDGMWEILAQRNDPGGLLQAIDFVGFNFYPYWMMENGRFKNLTLQQGKVEFFRRVQEVTSLPLLKDKTIILTEEGWPSSHSPGQNPNTSIANKTDYYKWWKEREGSDRYDSYFFSMYDKLGNNGADSFFGLCKADRGVAVKGTVCK